MSLRFFALLPLLALVRGDDSVAMASTAYSSGSLGVAPVQSFTSTSLSPPELNFLTSPTSSVVSNYTFLAYRGSQVSQAAPLILDNNGSLVWSGATFGQAMDTKVQTYQGSQYLTFFNVSFFSGGYGLGQWLMLDSSYNVAKTVNMVNQSTMTADFHEFKITENDTALIESWVVVQTDLSSLNGSATGWTWDCRFQEVDIATNELLFEWHSLDYVPVNETFFTISDNAGESESNPFDYCHINSLEKDANGNYLVSLRGPSTVYSISSSTGEILWSLGGKSTSFTMNEGSTFWYQHDARFLTPITSNPFQMTLFDNAAGGGGDAEATARGLVLSIDTSAMTATLVTELIPSFNTTSASQGSVQVLSNGNFFVGWGAEPYFTEYASDASIVWDVQFGSQNSTSVESYRAKKMAWVGQPTYVPSLGLNSTGGTTAYASWNGATEVATWSLMGGSSTTGMTSVLNTTRSGFETAMTVSGAYTYLAAAALSSNGTCLGVSEIYTVSSQASTGTVGSCPSGGSSPVTSVAASGPTGVTSAGSAGASASATVTTTGSAPSLRIGSSLRITISALLLVGTVMLAL